MRPFYDWVNSTGIDGISHTVAANSAWEKSAWFIIAVVGLGFTAVQVIMVMTDYLGYPVTVSINITHKSSVSEKRIKPSRKSAESYVMRVDKIEENPYDNPRPISCHYFV